MPTPLAPTGEKRERVVFGDETKLVELPEGHSLAKPDPSAQRAWVWLRQTMKDTSLTCLTRRVSEQRYIVQSKGKSEEQLTSLDAKIYEGIFVMGILCKRVVV